MGNKVRLIFCVSYILLLGISGSGSLAQSVNKFNVKDRLSINLPTGWEIHDRTEREGVSDQATRLMGSGRDSHTAALSAGSSPRPSKLRVRVSFVKLDSFIGQRELNQLLSDSSKGEVIKVFQEVFDSEMLPMWRNLAKVGVYQVGKSTISIGKIGGLTAIILRYQRTSGPGDKGVVNVSQYHVMLGAEKSIITFSNSSDEPHLIKTLQNIKNSISFK